MLSQTGRRAGSPVEPSFQIGDTVGHLHQRVVDRLEGARVAVVGAAGDFLDAAHVGGQLLQDRDIASASAGRQARRDFLGGLAGRRNHVVAPIGEMLADLHQTRGKLGERSVAVHRGRRHGEPLRQLGDLGFDVLQRCRVLRMRPLGRDPLARRQHLGDFLDTALHVVERRHRRGVALALLDALRQFGHARIERLEHAHLGFLRKGALRIETGGDFLESRVELLQHRVRCGGRRRPLIQPPGQLIEPVGNRLVDTFMRGQRRGCFMQGIQPRTDFGQLVLDGRCARVRTGLLELPRQRRQARLDPLEGGGIEFHRRRGNGNRDDGAADLVEPFLDRLEVGRRNSGIVRRQCFHRLGQCPDLRLHRLHRVRIRQCMQNQTDVGNAVGDRQQVFARAERLRQGADFLLDHRPAVGHVAQRVLACECGDMRLQILDFRPQGSGVAVLDPRGDDAEFPRQAVESVGDIDLRAAGLVVLQPPEFLADLCELPGNGCRQLKVEGFAHPRQFVAEHRIAPRIGRTGRTGRVVTLQPRPPCEHLLASADRRNIAVRLPWRRNIRRRSGRTDSHAALKHRQRVVQFLQRGAGVAAGSVIVAGLRWPSVHFSPICCGAGFAYLIAGCPSRFGSRHVDLP